MKFLFIIERETFCSRYRVEHFCEQLSFHGVQFNTVLSDNDLCSADLMTYDIVIIYRCAINSNLVRIIQQIHKCGKKCLYDIDDYIFNYNNIKELDFIANSTSTVYAEYSDAIYECMDLCDGLIASTVTLAKAMEQEFNHKKIFVKRNIASVKMARLSADVICQKCVHEPIILGYFSGTHSHDLDFQTIEGGLIQVFEKYPNIFLYIVGPLNISKDLNAYSERIKRFSLVDWQELPSLIGAVDINLIPLQNTKFHNCKSENKWMEAALVEVPSVMQYNDEVSLVIEAERTGFFYENERQFLATLETLIENPDIRKSVSRQANKVVLEKYITSSSDFSVIQSMIEFCCGKEGSF